MASKLADVQWQIRQNAEEHKAFVTSLSDWARDMQTADEKLQSSASTPANSSVAPIRGSGSIASDDVSKEARIHATDYDRWNKFNADEEEQKVDTRDRDRQDQAKVAAQDEEEKNAKLAEVEKETGNVYFKKGKFAKAVAHYTKAAELNPRNAVYFSNKAMALLKLDRHADAEDACTTALQLEPRNIKALWRRSTARREMGKIQEAKTDLDRALVLEPGNATFKSDLAALQKQMQPVTKEVAQTVPRRRRIPIREVGGTRPTNTADMPPNRPIIEEVASRRVSETPRTVADAPAQSLPAPSPPKGQRPVSPPPETPPTPLQRAAPPMDPAPLTVLPPPPMASFEFERDMKLMTDATELQYQYLKSIALPNLPKIFTSLDASQLGKVLGIVHRSYLGREDPKLIFNTLNQMSKCMRFSVARMLLERHEVQST
ncbi:hypothetical protein RI367_004934 [Sorochytrium milnesiophthora]